MHAAPYVYRYAAYGPEEASQPACEKLRWLSAAERQVYERLLDSQRRESFVRGRILAKRLILLEYCASLRLGGGMVHPADIEIDSGLARRMRQSPRVKIGGQPLPWSISIAHTQRGVLVAAGRTPGVRVGVDLVEPAAMPRGFADFWFTAAERRWLRDARPEPVATLWAIKEAVYKTIAGERPFAPRAIEVLPHERRGFVSRPACMLSVWRTPQGQTAVIAYTFKNCQGD